ncbi:hypothetical protein AWC38_SpisGene14243 [Stylophora pistillata]|uniref:Uncharacterized protein n=1 Tax=Stylophora pistillata TaxID=50429 RepID=A0A2B4RY56_STYPI|nr:hypothetical protein AWC38_SpisGene14243 [Stylophora pistillata]
MRSRQITCYTRGTRSKSNILSSALNTSANVTKKKTFYIGKYEGSSTLTLADIKITQGNLHEHICLMETLLLQRSTGHVQTSFQADIYVMPSGNTRLV